MQNVIMLEDGWAKLKTGGVQKIEEILEDMKDGVYKNLVWLATVIAQTIDVFGNCLQATPLGFLSHGGGGGSPGPPPPPAASSARTAPGPGDRIRLCRPRHSLSGGWPAHVTLPH